MPGGAEYPSVSDGHGEVPGPASRDIEDLDKVICRIARGEAGAFERAFRQLYGPVYGMALTVVRDQAQAEEVAQDVLVEVWRTAGRYDPGKSGAVTWALMITRRRAIDRIRSAAAGTRRERGNTVTDVPWDQVSETAGQSLECEQLRDFLHSLSYHQREAIVLAFYGGYTHADIAAILDIPVGTVKGRIRLALARLRDWMQETR
jgi:RNA polymerase sigma-70 factor, ECF subfamily